METKSSSGKGLNRTLANPAKVNAGGRRSDGISPRQPSGQAPPLSGKLRYSRNAALGPCVFASLQEQTGHPISNRDRGRRFHTFGVRTKIVSPQASSMRNEPMARSRTVPGSSREMPPLTCLADSIRYGRRFAIGYPLKIQYVPRLRDKAEVANSIPSKRDV